MDSKRFLGQLANELAGKKQKMNSQQLAAALNAANCETSYGSDYKGGRGTDRLKSTAYDYYENIGNNKTAKNIAEVFVDINNKTPWCDR